MYVYLQPDWLCWRFCHTECIWVLFWDQSCSYCTPLTCCSSCDDINCTHMQMPMIRKSADRAFRLKLTRFGSVYRSASMTCHSGWHLTGCNSILWCASARRQHQIPTSPVRIGNTTVLPVTAVRDLGVYVNADVSLAAHVTPTVRTCFAAPLPLSSGWELSGGGGWGLWVEPLSYIINLLVNAPWSTPGGSGIIPRPPTMTNGNKCMR